MSVSDRANGSAMTVLAALQRMVAALGLVVGALSLLGVLASGFAPRAYASDLQMGELSVQAQEAAVVYDSVYGVFGGEYALMFKNVAYEEKDANGTTQATNGSVADLVNSSGQVTVHTSSLPQSSAMQPGGWTDIQLQSFTRYCNDVNAGYIKVKKKSTCKYGVIATDGSWIAECVYDDLQRIGDDFVGVAYGSSAAEVSFIGKDGSLLGKTALAVNLSNGSLIDRQFSCSSFYGYFNLSIYEWYSADDMDEQRGDSMFRSGAVITKNSSGYTQVEGLKKIWAGDDSGGIVLEKNDDKIYYRSPIGRDSFLCNVEADGRISIYRGIIWVRFSSDARYSYYKITSEGTTESVAGVSAKGYVIADADGYYYHVSFGDDSRVKLASVAESDLVDLEGNFIGFKKGFWVDEEDGRYFETESTQWFSVNGKQLPNNIGSLCDWYWLNWRDYSTSPKYALFCSWSYRNGVGAYTCRIYDIDGAKVGEFVAAGADLLVSCDENWNITDTYYYSVTRVESQSVNGDGDEGVSHIYNLSVYRLDGTLVKDLGEVSAPDACLNAFNYPPTYGYELPGRYTVNGKTVYYDLDFNQLGSRPTSPSSGSGGSSSGISATPVYTLPNGTGLYRKSLSTPDATTGSYYQITDANDSEVIVKGYTLGLAGAGVYDSARNAVKHGGADIWWAHDKLGKWGAIDSSGNVKVPFVYDSYCDSGYDNTDFALVRKDGAWSFVNVQTGKTYGTTTAPNTLADAKVSAPAQTFTGGVLTPAVTVKLAGNVLSASAYNVSYPKAINAGSYLITVTGKGDYGGTVTGIFVVNGKPLNAAKITGLAKKTYTGKAQKQSKLVVTESGKTLKLGSDYTLSYKNNKKAGTAKVVITGKGNYAGKVTRTFTIAKAKMAKTKVAKVKARKLKKAGKAVKPKPKVKYKGKKLKLGRDYTLSYKNNKNVGTAKIIIKGKGNFKGKKVVKFTIK